MNRIATVTLVLLTSWLGMGHATWTNLWYETLDYTEDDGWRLIDQGSDSQINPAIVLADHDLLVVRILTNGHDCCTINHGPGCSDATIEEAVCSVDAYCCTTVWDNTCVNQVPDATADKYLCPSDYSSENLAVDNGGENGGNPDITIGCAGDSYICYKTTRIGTMSGGGNGRIPLIVELLPSLDGGWGYLAVNYVVRSVLYRNASQNPDPSVSRSFDVRYLPIGGGSPETGYVYLDLTSVNDPPVVQTNSTLTVEEGSWGYVNSSRLYATDVDNTSGQIFWTLRYGAGPLHGTMLLSGSSAAWVTQGNVNATMVRYQHDGSEGSTDTLGFTLTDTHNCCVDARGPGCSDPAIQACVCAADSYCCTTRWDTVCAGQVASTCGAVCGASAGNVDLSIAVSPVNDPPVVVTNTTLSVAEGQTATISNAHLRATDVDNTTSQLLWSVVTPAEHGTLRLNTTPVLSITQTQIDAGSVNYRHDGSETTSDQIVFNLSDGGATALARSAVIGPVVFYIDVVPVNDPPSLVTNNPLSVGLGHEAPITHSLLAVWDPDNTAAQLYFTVTSGPAHGELELSSLPTASFTQANVDSGLVSYLHDGSATTGDSFVFVVDDGDDGTIGATVFTIAVQGMIFSDDFESGDTTMWSSTLP